MITKMYEQRKKDASKFHLRLSFNVMSLKRLNSDDEGPVKQEQKAVIIPPSDDVSSSLKYSCSS
jgi:hypothetical protein